MDKKGFINIKGIVILIAIVMIIHFVVGFLISPFVGEKIVQLINKNNGSKVSIEKVHLWPFTLSLSLKNMKVFDPKGEERIVHIKNASIRFGFWALLSKRLVISSVIGNGVEINLESKPDGSFNVEQIVQPPAEKGIKKKPMLSLQGKDWFTRIYNTIKKISSKKQVEQKKEEQVAAKQVQTTVEDLPKGRRIKFETLRSGYLFEIKTLTLKNIDINVDPKSAEAVDIKKGSLKITGIYADPDKGANFNSIAVKGGLFQKDKAKGYISLLYKSKIKGKDLISTIHIKTSDMDLPALSFVYYDSLPVNIQRGILDFDSRTVLINDQIDSTNKIILKDQVLQAKDPSDMVAGFAPMSELCNAINQIEPLKLQFDITGTLSNPQFKGLDQSLKRIIEPYIKDKATQLIQQGLQSLTKKDGSTTGGSNNEQGADRSVETAVNALKGLFSNE